MTDITLHNIQGLYTGAVAQIAASLVFPTNDNFRSESIMREALSVMKKILDENPDGLLENASTDKLYEMVERQPSWNADQEEQDASLLCSSGLKVYTNSQPDQK